MRRLRERFPNELAIVGVHSGKFPAEHETSNIREAVLRHEIEHPVVNDLDFQIWRSHGVSAWPTVVLIDPLGRYIGSQPGEITAEDFIPIIEGIVQEFDAAGQINRRPLDLRPEAEGEPERALRFPSRLALGPERRLFVADTGHHRVVELELDESGGAADVRRVFGRGAPALVDGAGATAAFHSPHGLALAGARLYVADTDNHAVRLIDLGSGTVSTVAGNGQKASGPLELGSPTETPLRSPWAVLVADELIFIAMAGAHQIWLLVDSRLEVAESVPRLIPFAGNGREALVDGPRTEASFNQPSDLALGLNHLLIADAEASAIRALSLDAEPRVITLIGQGLFEFGDVDGAGAEARLQHPTGLAFAGGLAFIADTYNNKIKTLDPASGSVASLIGTGRQGDRDGAFGEAELNEPEGVAVSAGGRRLYIADTNNHLIRVADLETRTVSTLAMRGLERLERAWAPAQGEVTLPAAEVRPGEVQLTLAVELPPGYEINPEGPTRLREAGDGLGPDQWSNGSIASLRLRADASRDARLDLTVYYCEADDKRLCLVHDRRLILPLHVVEGGAAAIQIKYTLPVPNTD